MPVRINLKSLHPHRLFCLHILLQPYLPSGIVHVIRRHKAISFLNLPGHLHRALALRIQKYPDGIGISNDFSFFILYFKIRVSRREATMLCDFAANNPALLQFLLIEMCSNPAADPALQAASYTCFRLFHCTERRSQSKTSVLLLLLTGHKTLTFYSRKVFPMK